MNGYWMIVRVRQGHSQDWCACRDDADARSMLFFFVKHAIDGEDYRLSWREA